MQITLGFAAAAAVFAAATGNTQATVRDMPIDLRKFIIILFFWM
jgi:hypothetical protein